MRSTCRQTNFIEKAVNVYPVICHQNQHAKNHTCTLKSLTNLQKCFPLEKGMRNLGAVGAQSRAWGRSTWKCVSVIVLSGGQSSSGRRRRTRPRHRITSQLSDVVAEAERYSDSTHMLQPSFTPQHPPAACDDAINDVTFAVRNPTEADRLTAMTHRQNFKE